MSAIPTPDLTPAPVAPSAWVVRFLGLIPPGGTVLDLACGRGRHVRLLLARGYRVVAVDRDVSGLGGPGTNPGLEIVAADLETPTGWPLGQRRFEGIVVTNYLHRPLLPAIVAALAPGGALIYETFAVGNERFGRPANPHHLLKPGELIEAVRGRLEIVAYETLETDDPRPAVVQRLAAVNR
jgi:SAM-dependent methyltransferase